VVPVRAVVAVDYLAQALPEALVVLAQHLALQQQQAA
jgi:hypothetical protein